MIPESTIRKEKFVDYVRDLWTALEEVRMTEHERSELQSALFNIQDIFEEANKAAHKAGL